MKKKEIRIQLVRSLIGVQKRHQDTVKSLGLRKINHFTVLPATEDVLGKINQVAYLLKIEEK